MKEYGYLLLAILLEVMATATLKAANGFTKLIPSVVVAIGYIAASYYFSLCLQTIGVGIAYAIWSGLGIILLTLIGWKIYGQEIDLPGAIGIGLIIVGLLVLNLFSKTVFRE